MFAHMRQSRETLPSYDDEDLAKGDSMSKRIALNRNLIPVL